ncbi:YbaB/EbfC DNA-binding family protein [Lentzea aerocolonigenes]|nr:YbaB/EbfC DNA-binding family protein [Lentzea aerocolonigenes]
MDPYAWVNDFKTRAAELQRKNAEVQENLAGVSGTASSKDGAVKVTVGPNGGLMNLQLGHRAVELGAPRLTALILETARQAQKNAATQVIEAFRPIGEGTQAMAMITDVVEEEFGEEPEEEHAVERIEEDDAPASAPAAPAAAAASEPRQARAPRRADDEDDDDNQPW